MKILIFTEGTILMHQGAVGHSREEIVQQIINEEKTVHKYESYISIGEAVNKLNNWKYAGHEIIYLTSRRITEEINAIQSVLDKFGFPKGMLEYRKDRETYADVAERVMPDVLIEDDCESIGGQKEMTYTHISPEKKPKIRSIVVKEFSGVDSIKL